MIANVLQIWLIAEFKNLIMNIEREIKVRDAIKYCIENFDIQTATNRIIEFWKDELKLQEQQLTISAISNRREQLIAFSDAINIFDGDSEKIGKLVDLYLKSI